MGLIASTTRAAHCTTTTTRRAAATRVATTSAATGKHWIKSAQRVPKFAGEPSWFSEAVGWYLDEISRSLLILKLIDSTGS